MTPPALDRLSAAALQQALDALARYTAGSPRGPLLPLDDAVAQATTDPARARELQTRLLALLHADTPAEAREYICRQLILIGTAPAVPALTALLNDPAVAHAARGTLEVLPDPAAGQALRDAIPKLSGLLRVGAITSLGRRREMASVPLLANLLRDSDEATATAAVAGLGDIASPESGAALRAFLPHAPAVLRPVLADACLACAERLPATEHRDLARELYAWCQGEAQPRHVQSAAAAGLARLTPTT